MRFASLQHLVWIGPTISQPFIIAGPCGRCRRPFFMNSKRTSSNKLVRAADTQMITYNRPLSRLYWNGLVGNTCHNLSVGLHCNFTGLFMLRLEISSVCELLAFKFKISSAKFAFHILLERPFKLFLDESAWGLVWFDKLSKSALNIIAHMQCFVVMWNPSAS